MTLVGALRKNCCPKKSSTDHDKLKIFVMQFIIVQPRNNNASKAFDCEYNKIKRKDGKIFQENHTDLWNIK